VFLTIRNIQLMTEKEKIRSLGTERKNSFLADDGERKKFVPNNTADDGERKNEHGKHCRY
jgi:hypothetical protein